MLFSESCRNVHQVALSIIIAPHETPSCSFGRTQPRNLSFRSLLLQRGASFLQQPSFKLQTRQLGRERKHSLRIHSQCFSRKCFFFGKKIAHFSRVDPGRDENAGSAQQCFNLLTHKKKEKKKNKCRVNIEAERSSNF